MKINSCPKTSPLAGVILALLGIINLVQPARAQTASVNWTNVYQRMDGFGACSAWRSTWTTNQANMFFSTNSGTGKTLDGKTNFSFNGIDLSLLRTRIAPGGTSVETNIMVQAQALGARVWSTPWTPQATWKTPQELDGGNFVSTNNQAYANQLAGYVVSMKNNYKINLYAISVQNEPDANVTNYEACTWTAAQIEQFVPYLYNALAASNVASTKIVVAEDEHWQTNLYYTTMTNSAAAADVSIVACHNYDGNNTPAALPLYDNTNAALWETEVSTIGGAFDGSISNAVYWAGRIHLFMTGANANAWHFWWLISNNSDNEGLTDTNGYPALRMYALGNFSRFVRPGFYRIGVNNSGSTSISAYKNTNSGSFAIVAINSGSTTVTQVFNLTNFTAASVTPWITSGTLSLVSQASVAVTNSSFTYGLPAQSVVTFVGQGYVSPLTASAGGAQTICAGGSTPIGGSPTATNGVSPYTYSWSPATGLSSTTVANPTASPTSTTTYTVTVTDSQMSTAQSSMTVTVHALPTVSVNSATVCAGGSATLTATTGASSPSYLWSPGGATTGSIMVSPSSTTAYTVTVTDGTTGCANSGSGTVTVNPLPTVSVNSATVCAGGSATLTATTSASSPNYLWSPGGATTVSITVSPSSTTTYTATVTDGTTGCANSGSGTVTINPPPTAAASGSATICNGSSTTISAALTGAEPWNVTWSDGTQQNGVASSPATRSVSPSSTTTYAVTALTDANGCPAQAGGLTGSAVVTIQCTMTIYSNSLASGWQDWSYNTTRNFSNTSPVYSDSEYSISVTITTNYGGLQLYHSPLADTNCASISFWLNGGVDGGQQLQMYGLLDIDGTVTAQAPLYSLSTPQANTWLLYTVPLAALGVANVTNFSGFAIQDSIGGAEPVFYLDDIELVSATAPSVTLLSVNASQPIRTADARWFGLNTPIWDSVLDTPQTMALLTNMGAQALRFPGGSDSDDFHWLQNKEDNDDWRWTTTTANFIDVITNLGAQTMITLNYGTGSSNEAAAWVAYVNASTNNTRSLGVDATGYNWQTAGYWASLRAAAPLATDDGTNFLRISRTAPLGFKYWEIGNEQYGSWETDSNSLPHDPYTYAVQSQGYISLIKAVDPAAKIGVVVTPGVCSHVNNTNHPAVDPVTGQTNYGWTPVLLATLKSLGVTPDFAIHHRYPQNAGGETDAGLLASTNGWASDAENLRQQITDYVGSNGTNIELVCTENNSVGSTPGKQTVSLVNGLFKVDSMAQLMQTEFNGLFWWDLRDALYTNGNMSSSLYGWRLYGDTGVVSNGYATLYPTYYTAELMTHFAQTGDTVITAASDWSLLPAYAVRRLDGSLTVLVINKDPSNTIAGLVSVAGFTPASSGTVYSYGIPQDDAVEYGSGSPDVAQTNISVTGTNISYAFPPYSATVLALSPAPATLLAISQAASQFVFQIQGQAGVPYVVESSTNLITWTPVSTNTPLASTMNITNSLAPSMPEQFWRVIWQP